MFIEKDNFDLSGTKVRFACSSRGPNSPLDVELPDGSVLRVGKIKVEGANFQPAGNVVWRQANHKKIRN